MQGYRPHRSICSRSSLASATSYYSAPNSAVNAVFDSQGWEVAYRMIGPWPIWSTTQYRRWSYLSSQVWRFFCALCTTQLRTGFLWICFRAPWRGRSASLATPCTTCSRSRWWYSFRSQMSFLDSILGKHCRAASSWIKPVQSDTDNHRVSRQAEDSKVPYCTVCSSIMAQWACSHALITRWIRGP